MKHKRASLSRDGRLTLSARRDEINWLTAEPGDKECVVTLVRPGVLKITTLKSWARKEGVTEEQASKLLSNGGHTGIPKEYLAEAKRKPGGGSSLYRISLPDAAIWYLFRAGEGLMGGAATGQSVRVLVTSDTDGARVHSHEAWDMVEQEDEDRDT